MKLQIEEMDCDQAQFWVKVDKLEDGLMDVEMST
jgi:hypothetical protein